MKANDKGPRRAQVMIVDDHPLVRAGLRELINDERDLEVCGEAASPDEAIRVVDDKKPDLMIVDLSLKAGSGGLELIKRLKSRNPDIKILVSSMHEESLYAERVLSAGALGYVHKQEATDKVIEAIRTVLAGRVYLSEATSDFLLRRVTDRKSVERSNMQILSDRELEVFEMIGRGRGTRDIALQLHLSVKTVESHREHIKNKLSLKSSAELVSRAVQWVLEQGV